MLVSFWKYLRYQHILIFAYISSLFLILINGITMCQWPRIAHLSFIWRYNITVVYVFENLTFHNRVIDSPVLNQRFCKMWPIDQAISEKARFSSFNIFIPLKFAFCWYFVYFNFISQYEIILRQRTSYVSLETLSN